MESVFNTGTIFSIGEFYVEDGFSGSGNELMKITLKTMVDRDPNVSSCCLKDFTPKFREGIDNFKESIKITNLDRRGVRRIWLFKQMYELLELYMGALVANEPNLFIKSYSKVFEILEDPDVIRLGKSSNKILSRSVSKAMDCIRRVFNKFHAVVTADVKYVRLLTQKTLLSLIEIASPTTISKFSLLPWIDPNVAANVTPKFNLYKTTFWCAIFMKIFKIGHDMSFKIAEYMPLILRGETFPEFFRRKFRDQIEDSFVLQEQNFVAWI